MGPYVDSVGYDHDLPSHSDVVIIGGGIIGVSAALELARRGISVTLCEKGYVAGEQSSRNWGWCRQAGRDEREMPLITESLRLWRNMEAFVDADVGFAQCGTTYVGDGEKDRADFENWLAMAQPYETGARMVSGDEFERLMKAPPQGRFALHVPTDGRAEPQKAAPAIARAAIKAGATILSPCAVRVIEQSAGQVSGVVTERGRIRCNAVIVAAGAWSSLICSSLGFSLPQMTVRGSVLRTSRVENGPESCTWIGQLGFRKRHDGGYTIADGATFPTPIGPESFKFLRQFTPMLRQEWRGAKPYLSWDGLGAFFQRSPAPDRPSIFEQVRTLDPRPDMALLNRSLRTMAKIYPQFEAAQITQAWAGLIDVAPDAIPYIGQLPSTPGVTLATGFSGHGFGIGPAAGGLAARIAVGDASEAGVASMRLTRFNDGSPIILGTGP
ncbi:MAG: FAD-binding oxidoreductase [Rhodobacteraceae bacterium]|nr:FAD-binding oxidoreductase [Paracoccaceae bacterium]